jgi:hypothetical protein
MFVYSLCIVFLIVGVVYTKVVDKVYNDLLYLPLSQNPTNPNYYEVSVVIDGNEYSLPLNLMNSSIQIPLNAEIAGNDISPTTTTTATTVSSSSLFENFTCAKQSSTNIMNELTLTTSNQMNCTFNNIPYQTVTQYEPQCNYRQYFGLNKHSNIITLLREQQPSLIKANEFSISLNNNNTSSNLGKGMLLIGEHMELLKEHNEPLFCRPIEEPSANGRWGCQIHGALPEDNLNRLSINGLLKVDTDLRSGKEYFLTVKKTAASDRYQSFYFDMNFQYILTTYKFLVYLKNFYFKQSISNNICEIKNNTSLNILAFYCNEQILTTLQPIHFLIGYHTVKFNAEDLFMKTDVNDDNSSSSSSNSVKCYMFQVVGRNNKKGSEWIFGHPLFKKYTVMFNKESDIIYIFSTTFPIATVNVEYSYTPPKSANVPDVDVDVEEDLFDVNINGQHDEMGIDIDKTKFNQSKLISFSVGMICCVGIFYLLYYRLSYTRFNVKDNIIIN